MDATEVPCLQDPSIGVGCGTVPELERLCYFFGQLLEPADFRAEQSYFSTLLSLLARHAAGWGVACGLDITFAVGEPDTCDDQPEHELLTLCLTPGIAIDCRGRLIIVREPYRCRLWPLLGAAEHTALRDGKPVYLSIQHAEHPVQPSRAVGDECDPLAAVQYGRLKTGWRLIGSVSPPETDRCDGCTELCPDPRVLLGSVRLVEPGTSATVSVRAELRRLLGRHELTAITDVGWVHGGTYSRRSAERLLSAGIGVRFSGPVRASGFAEGVVDLVVYEGGGGRRDAWYPKSVDVTIEPSRPSADTGVEFTSGVTVRLSQPEGYQVGDRILLRVRCDFVLDECCRAVSGAHLGGGVPFDAALAKASVDHPQPVPPACPHPPDRSGPWRSGNGAEGGTWETWIKVGPDPGGESTS